MSERSLGYIYLQAASPSKIRTRFRLNEKPFCAIKDPRSSVALKELTLEGRNIGNLHGKVRKTLATELAEIDSVVKSILA